MSGICASEGERVNFMRFMRYGLPITVAQLAVSARTCSRWSGSRRTTPKSFPALLSASPMRGEGAAPTAVLARCPCVKAGSASPPRLSAAHWGKNVYRPSSTTVLRGFAM